MLLSCQDERNERMNKQDKCALCERAFKIGELKLVDNPPDPTLPAFCGECATALCMEELGLRNKYREKDKIVEQQREPNKCALCERAFKKGNRR